MASHQINQHLQEIRNKYGTTIQCHQWRTPPKTDRVLEQRSMELVSRSATPNIRKYEPIVSKQKAGKIQRTKNKTTNENKYKREVSDKGSDKKSKAIYHSKNSK